MIDGLTIDHFGEIQFLVLMRILVSVKTSVFYWLMGLNRSSDWPRWPSNQTSNYQF